MIELKRLTDAFILLKKEAKEDTKSVDKANVDNNFNMSALHFKWLDYLHEWRRVKKALDSMKKRTIRDLYTYYTTEFDIKLTSKDQIFLYIEADDKYINLNEKYEISKDIIEFCISVSKILENKQWEIKNYLDWLKYSNGMN